MLNLPNVKTFQGYANKVQEDLNKFFMMQKVDLKKIRIAQSETDGVINLTLIYWELNWNKMSTFWLDLIVSLIRSPKWIQNPHHVNYLP